LTKRAPEDAQAQEAERKAILACQGGDMDAFEILYAKYHRGLYAYLLSMLRSPHVAEDLTQDIFIKLFRQIGSYRFQSPFAHWLFRLARNLAIDHLRKEKVRFASSLDADNDEGLPLRERLAGKAETPAAHSLLIEKTAVIRQAVEELPEDFRVVVVLREWDELAYEEIGKRLGLSTGTVKSRLFRARGLLAKKLKGWEKD
jgi:RNA polymerase sigma-70 factor (ECF subfamily)